MIYTAAALVIVFMGYLLQDLLREIHRERLLAIRAQRRTGARRSLRHR